MNMIVFVVLGVLVTFASLSNGASESSAPLSDGTYHVAALDVFDRTISNEMYPTAVNVAAMDIFNTSFPPPFGDAVLPKVENRTEKVPIEVSTLPPGIGIRK